MGESGVQTQLHLHKEFETSQAGLCETLFSNKQTKTKEKRKKRKKRRPHLLKCRRHLVDTPNKTRVLQ